MARRRRPPRPGALTDLSPLRILTQIVVLQAGFYGTALILIVFSALAAGRHVSLDLMFSWRHLRGDVTEGYMLGVCWMMTSLICVIYLLLLVARSKLVPDFALTIHFLHLIATSLYSYSLPTNLFWWFIQAASAALMTFLGIWSCQWRELRPLKFGGHAASHGQGQQDGAHDVEDGVGYIQGSGGGGRDGSGAYEMVAMKQNGSA